MTLCERTHSLQEGSPIPFNRTQSATSSSTSRKRATMETSTDIELFTDCRLRMASRQPSCELCSARAVVYCAADEAHLCGTCDGNVHSANFIVCRHFRSILCHFCSKPTIWQAYGSRPYLAQYLCDSCSCGHAHQSMHFAEVGGAGKTPCARDNTGTSSSGAECLDESSFHTPAAPLIRKRGAGLDQRVPSGGRIVGHESDESTFSTSDTCRMEKESDDSPTSVLTSHKQQAILKRSRREVSSATTISDLPSSSSSSVASCSPCRPLLKQSEDDITSRKRAKLSVADPSIPFKQGKSDSDDLKQSRILGKQATARLQRVLRAWYTDLDLLGPEIKSLSFFLFQRVLKSLRSGKVAVDSLRVTLAACLWTAAKLDDKQSNVPKAHEVAAVTGVDSAKLASAEMQILKLLNWRPLKGWIKTDEGAQ